MTTTLKLVDSKYESNRDGEMLTDGGRDIHSEFYVETSVGDRFHVTKKDYEAVEWIKQEYGDRGDIVNDTVGFDERFAAGLNDYLEDIEENQAAERAVTYSAAAGLIVSDYFDRKDWFTNQRLVENDEKSVKKLFEYSANAFASDNLINTLSNFVGLFIPKSGHGTMNPYNKEVGICQNTILTAAHNGFILESSGSLPPSFYAGNEISCEQCINMLEE